jgi:type I restriction enzyme S subunit
VSFTDLRYVPVDLGEVKNYLLQDGDLLFTRYNGSRDFVGVCGQVHNLRGQLIYPDKLIRARVHMDYVLPGFLEVYFASKVGRVIIERKAKTTAGQYGISGGDLKSVPIVLPPLAEQQQIVAEVERCLSVADEVERTVDASLKQAERLRQSILRQAFAGKLVPQDPGDEPAERLLERIRAGRGEDVVGARHSRKRS